MCSLNTHFFQGQKIDHFWAILMKNVDQKFYCYSSGVLFARKFEMNFKRITSFCCAKSNPVRINVEKQHLFKFFRFTVICTAGNYQKNFLVEIFCQYHSPWTFFCPWKKRVCHASCPWQNGVLRDASPAEKTGLHKKRLQMTPNLEFLTQL